MRTGREGQPLRQGKEAAMNHCCMTTFGPQRRGVFSQIVCGGILMVAVAGCQSGGLSSAAPGQGVAQLVAQARSADQAGRSDEAARLYERLLTIDPSNSAAKSRLIALQTPPQVEQYAAAEPVPEVVAPSTQDARAIEPKLSVVEVEPPVNALGDVSPEFGEAASVGTKIALGQTSLAEDDPTLTGDDIASFEQFMSSDEETIEAADAGDFEAFAMAAETPVEAPERSLLSKRRVVREVASSDRVTPKKQVVGNPTNAAPGDLFVRISSEKFAAVNDAATRQASAAMRQTKSPSVVKSPKANTSRTVTRPSVVVDRIWQRWQDGGSTEETAAALVAALRSPSSDQKLRDDAVAALGQMRGDGRTAVPALRAYLLDSAKRAPQSTRAIRVADAILRIDPGDEMATRALLAVLQGGSASQRVAAASALGQGDGRVVPLLAESLEDSSEPVRAAAALALARHGRDAAVARRSLEAAARFDTPVVRQAARTALGRL